MGHVLCRESYRIGYDALLLLMLLMMMMNFLPTALWALMIQSFSPNTAVIEFMQCMSRVTS